MTLTFDPRSQISLGSKRENGVQICASVLRNFVHKLSQTHTHTHRHTHTDKLQSYNPYIISWGCKNCTMQTDTQLNLRNENFLCSEMTDVK